MPDTARGLWPWSNQGFVPVGLHGADLQDFHRGALPTVIDSTPNYYGRVPGHGGVHRPLRWILDRLPLRGRHILPRPQGTLIAFLVLQKPKFIHDALRRGWPQLRPCKSL